MPTPHTLAALLLLGLPGSCRGDALVQQDALARPGTLEEKLRRVLRTGRRPPGASISAPVRRAAPPARTLQGAAAPSSTGYCEDTPGWSQFGGVLDCAYYVTSMWCTGTGDYGPGWPANWGTFEGFSNALGQPVLPTEACCGCGGGSPCQDSPPGWRDSRGYGCTAYVQNGWCADGGPGPNWTKSWGSLQDFSVGGVDASAACCGCHVPKDSGGDGCEFYRQHPSLCGCCDDEDFTAQAQCRDICATPPAAPPSVAELFSNLPAKTTHILHAGAGISGDIGTQDWHRFANLSVVRLARNKLEGTIPAHVGNLTKLKIFDISYNSIAGTIPPELTQLASLQNLILEHNLLVGTLPAGLGRLSNLMYAYLDNNKLEGSLPRDLGRLTNLLELDLGSNALTGSIPPELGNLTSATMLYLPLNQLQGSIPEELGQLVQLIDLRLNNNLLTGTIPPSLGNLIGIPYVALSNNRLTGTVPPELGRMRSAVTFELRNNRLSGTLPPELGQLAGVTFLSLGMNEFQGTLPKEFGQLSSLITLDVFNNKLTGTIPAEIGQLNNLASLTLANNDLTGTIPTEMWQMAALTKVDLQNNGLTGTVPGDVRGLVAITTLSLAGNRLTGALPQELNELKSLQLLDVHGNPQLGGHFPNTTGCSALLKVYASNCSFVTAGPVGQSVEELHFAGNRIAHLPDAWQELPNVHVLDLSDNQISSWRPWGVIPKEAYQGKTSSWEYLCGFSPVERRLDWPSLQILDLSGNPLGNGTTLRDLIWSLAYVPQLIQLSASQCGLGGVLPFDGPGFAYDKANTGGGACLNDPPGQDGFRMLRTLDLSRNNITAIRAPPPTGLVDAMLQSNDLQGQDALHPMWYRTLSGLLSVRDNPLLRVPVEPPSSAAGCPGAGAEGPRASEYGWTPRGQEPFQCTSLCPGVRTSYQTDDAINASALCRCKPGMQGSGIDCSGCPADTYSVSQDEWEMGRECRACPSLATTEGAANATDLLSCRCPVGWYMGTPDGNATENTSTDISTPGKPTPACLRCPQWPFRTTLMSGAHQLQDCVCNPEYRGLRALLDRCGCVDGEYMDHVRKQCMPCDSAESCQWGINVEASLDPPIVEKGYWASSPEQGSANFSSNDIWRCFSKETCKGGGVCAEGRGGVACSLCVPGRYGGFDGACRVCPKGQKESWEALIVGLVCTPVLALVAHTMLRGSERTRRATILGSLRISMKQFVKYIQMLGVVSGFSVRWPPLASEFFNSLARLALDLPSFAGAACLTGKQTAAVEMTFRWLTPVAGLFSICLLALLLLPFRCWLTKHRPDSMFIMYSWDMVRVALWGAVLFYSTLLQYAANILTCEPSPNGKWTVAAFPHLVCGSGNGEWQGLAIAAGVFLAIFVVALFMAIRRAWQHSIHALVASGFQERGWWGFLFDDYRSVCSHWLLLIMLKDAGLVILSVVCAGQGQVQMMLTAAGSVIYAHYVLRDQPFTDPSNSLLEAWSALSIAVICVYGVGMGFSSAPGVGDFLALYSQGEADSQYRTRAYIMLVIQYLTLIGPIAILLYQILNMSAVIRRRLPKWLRPEEDEDRDKWNEEFFENVGLAADSNSLLFRSLVKRFDAVDAATFRNLMGTSAATVGMVRTTSRGLQGVVRARMSQVVQRNSSAISLQGSMASAKSLSGHLAAQLRNSLRSSLRTSTRNSTSAPKRVSGAEAEVEARSGSDLPCTDDVVCKGDQDESYSNMEQMFSV